MDAPRTATAPAAHGSAGARSLHTCPAVFLPDALPRAGRVAFWAPDGRDLPPSAPGAAAATEQLTVVRRHGSGARARTVPAVVLPVDDALPVLAAARHAPDAHPATACWGAAALHALHLVARGRLLPG